MISLNEKEITQIYRDDSLVEYIYKGDRPIYDCMIDYVLNDVNETCYVNRAGETYVPRQENIEYLYIPNKICKNSRIYKVMKVGTFGGYHNKFQTLKKALIGTPTDESGNMASVDHGFENRTSLEEVVITDSVFSIGDGAFLGCNKIAKMTLPPCVSRFDQIFGNEYDTSTGKWVPQSLKTVTVHSNWKIYSGLPGSFFYKCSYIETINIDIKNCESIGDNAFEGCSNLKTITIPNSVTSIGEDAFKGCDNLEYNEYDNGYYLGNNNNNNSCVALIKAKNQSIDSCIINKKTKIIYSKAFWGCSSLTSVIIGNSVTSIGAYAFYNCKGLTDITIPNSVTSIGDSAFEGCYGLTSVTIGNSVTSIGDHAFIDCRGLTGITIPNSVTSIGDYAFSACRGLTSVTIGNSVTSIGEAAFRDCSRLTSIIIPDSVTSIGNYAFFYCSGLTSVTMLPTNPPTLGSGALPSNVTTITVPVGCGNTYKTAVRWSAYAGKIVEATA